MDEKFKQCTFENWNHDIGSEKIFNICSKYASNFTKAKENNIILGNGYGAWKDTTFRIANFPAIEDWEFDQLKTLLRQ